MRATRMCPSVRVSGWRVDVATQAKTVAEMNDALSVFELELGDAVRHERRVPRSHYSRSAQSSGLQPPLRFELSRDEMETMVKTLDEIDSTLESLART